MTKTEGELRKTIAAWLRGSGGRQCPSCEVCPAMAVLQGQCCSARLVLEGFTCHHCNTNELLICAASLELLEMHMQMLDQNTFTGTGTYLQIVKVVFSKMKKVFTVGSLDADTLMVQGRLSNLSHAISAMLPSAP